MFQEGPLHIQSVDFAFSVGTEQFVFISHEGELFVRGKAVETDAELRQGFRDWLQSMGHIPALGQREDEQALVQAKVAWLMAQADATAAVEAFYANPTERGAEASVRAEMRAAALYREVGAAQERYGRWRRKPVESQADSFRGALSQVTPAPCENGSSSITVPGNAPPDGAMWINRSGWGPNEPGQANVMSRADSKHYREAEVPPWLPPVYKP